MKALEKREIRRIIYRSKLAMNNLDTAVSIVSSISHLLPEGVEENLRDARLCIIQATNLIGNRGDK